MTITDILIIAVSVDADGNITSVTSRWNFDDGRDNFLTVAQLREVLGDKYVQINKKNFVHY